MFYARKKYRKKSVMVLYIVDFGVDYNKNIQWTLEVGMKLFKKALQNLLNLKFIL